MTGADARAPRPEPVSLLSATPPRDRDDPGGSVHPSGAALTLGDILVITWAAALLAGAGHVAFVVLRVFVMHKFSWATRDIVWMAPLSYAAFIVPATLIVAVLARLWPRVVSARLLITVPAAMAIFGVLLLVRIIHPLALLAVSVGIGTQISRFFIARLPRARALLRYAVAAMLVGTIVASASIRGRPIMVEARARSVATAASEERPNILLIILDTVRAANMGLFGYGRDNTPELERLASEGVRFDRAIAPASWTLPTHASVFSGLDTRTVATGWRRSMDDSLVTLAEVLARQGYVSAGFTANPQFTTWETGLSQGFHRWDDFDVSVRETFWASSLAQTSLVRGLVTSSTWRERWRAIRAFSLKVPGDPYHVRRPGATIVDRFLDWQGSIGDKRFFGFLNLFDAHDPYVEPPGWTPKYTPRRSGMDTYDSAIAYMDAQLGRLFDALRETGVLDRTIVVVTSDHGEQFGGHGLILHGNSLYMRSIHVPLIIRTPHSEATGVVVQSPVSLSALPATLLDLAGLDEASIPGQSLRATWQGSTPLDSSHAHSWIEQHPWGRPNEPATAGSMTSLVDSTHHWIRHASGKTELYAYREDTLELNDRATDSSTVAIRKAFEERFRSARRP